MNVLSLIICSILNALELEGILSPLSKWHSVLDPFYSSLTANPAFSGGRVFYC